MGKGIPQILDMRFQLALTSDHMADFVEFRSASSEGTWRKK